jgi:hypothetical protein
MPRPQFSLKTMLWLVSCALCLCIGFGAGLAIGFSVRHDADIGEAYWKGMDDANRRGRD